MASPSIRKQMPGVELSEDEFKKRYRESFRDPAFEPLQDRIEPIAEAAWQAYANSRKAPHTRRAGPGFVDPDYELSIDWLAARDRIAEAEQRQQDPASPSRILLINGASLGSRARWLSMVAMSALRSNTRRTRATMVGSAFTEGKWIVTSTELRSGKCATATLLRLPSRSMLRCQTSLSIHSVPGVARNESADSIPDQS